MELIQRLIYTNQPRRELRMEFDCFTMAPNACHPFEINHKHIWTSLLSIRFARHPSWLAAAPLSGIQSGYFAIEEIRIAPTYQAQALLPHRSFCFLFCFSERKRISLSATTASYDERLWGVLKGEWKGPWDYDDSVVFCQARAHM